MPFLSHPVHGSILVFGYGDLIIDCQVGVVSDDPQHDSSQGEPRETEVYGVVFKTTHPGPVDRQILSRDEELGDIPVSIMFKTPESVEVLIRNLTHVRDGLQSMKDVQHEPSRQES